MLRNICKSNSNSICKVKWIGKNSKIRIKTGSNSFSILLPSLSYSVSHAPREAFSRTDPIRHLLPTAWNHPPPPLIFHGPRCPGAVAAGPRRRRRPRRPGPPPLPPCPASAPLSCAAPDIPRRRAPPAVGVATGRVRFRWSVWTPKIETQPKTRTRPKLLFGWEFIPKPETRGYTKPDE